MASFQRIAVATDPLDDGPAIAVGSKLGAHVGALELIAVSPNRTVARLDRADLERLAAIHGWVPAACTVLVGDNSTSTLVRHFGRRDRTLLVLAATGRYSCIIHDGAAALIAGDQPILAVGARVAPPPDVRSGTLFVLADEMAPDVDAIRAIDAWVTTFGADISVVHTAPVVTESPSAPCRWVDALSRNQLLTTRHETLTGVERALTLAADVPGAVIVTSIDLADPGINTDLLSNAAVPVLVVPSCPPDRRSDQRHRHVATTV